jgi:hypothetical protein
MVLSPPHHNLADSPIMHIQLPLRTVLSIFTEDLQSGLKSTLLPRLFLRKMNFVSKINPSSNFNADNDTRTAQPCGLQEVNIIEPIIGDKGKLQCPICIGVFSSREAYINHFLSKHQTSDLTSARTILAKVPYSVGFHFFITEGRYTGETAVSLVTFAKEVEVVPIESIDFHFKRADFLPPLFCRGLFWIMEQRTSLEATSVYECML